MAYAVLGDLSWGGNMTAPTDATHWLDAGADEIDSKIGFVYATPVVLSEAIPAQRPGALLLKKINSWLAMGRAILAASTGNSDDQLHQLGEYYVREALAALDAIASGQITLVGAELVNEQEDQSTGPMIANLEEDSLVETFDSVFGNPAKTVLAMDRCVPYPNSPYTY